MQKPVPQVDFYILPDSAPEQRALFACRLIEKIYKLRHCIYVHNNDSQQARMFDELLWRHQAASFIPHELLAANDAFENAGENAGSAATVRLIWNGEAEVDAGTVTAGAVLINLADSVPALFDRFARVSEIVVQTPEILAATRTAWRYYQQRGCALERHDLRATQR